jgi:hypothetical protein
MKKIIFLTLFFVLILSYELLAQLNSPSGLQAFYMEYNNTVRLSWNDNSINESGFYIERYEANSPGTEWETIGETGENIPMFYDYWLVGGSNYYYRVYAYGMAGKRSDYSNVDSVLIPLDTVGIPDAPSNLHIIDIQATSITIEWNDNANNEMGFMIARKEGDDLYFKIIDTVGADVLTYQEVELRPNTVYSYKVCAYNEHGISAYTNIVSGTTMENTSSINSIHSLPDKYFLGNNYPNPFNPVTNIRFGIPEAADVTLRVYNSLGKEISTIIMNEKLNAGIYEVSFNGHNLSSGIYFYRIESVSLTGTSGYFNDVRKMILIK